MKKKLTIIAIVGVVLGCLVSNYFILNSNWYIQNTELSLKD
jgi:hypothetical protein